MLKYSPFVWKDHYAAVLDELALVRETAMIRIQEAEEKYTITLDLLSQAATRELAARDIATRALILLQEVDTTRTGGKQLKALIAALLADATEQGLWGEIEA